MRYLKKMKSKAFSKLLSKHVKGKEVLTFVQEMLIDRIKEEIINFENAIRYAEDKYGHVREGFSIMNTFLFVRLSLIDIVILTKLYLESNKEYEKELLSRQLCINIYEILEDLPAIYGSQFKESIYALDDNVELIEGRKKIQKEIVNLKEHVSKEFYEIRNYTAAHKDHNSLKQLEILSNISQEKIINAALEIHSLYTQIGAYEKILIKYPQEQKQKTTPNIT